MRRAAAVVGLVALALGLFAISRPPAHAATTCAKHTKRVVKHVKRHGKRRRVVRLKHYWICEEVATPAPVPAPAQPAPSSPSPGATTPPAEPPVATPVPEPEPEANALGVAADDRGGVKKYTLSRESVRPGPLTVQLQNKGEDPHDMDIQRIGPDGEPTGEIVKVPVTGPGQNSDASVTVEAGEYRMWCDLYHHAEEGMEATVKVE
jgi:plastocyanin